MMGWQALDVKKMEGPSPSHDTSSEACSIRQEPAGRDVEHGFPVRTVLPVFVLTTLPLKAARTQQGRTFRSLQPAAVEEPFSRRTWKVVFLSRLTGGRKVSAGQRPRSTAEALTLCDATCEHSLLTEFAHIVDLAIRTLELDAFCRAKLISCSARFHSLPWQVSFSSQARLRLPSSRRTNLLKWRIGPGEAGDSLQSGIGSSPRRLGHIKGCFILEGSEVQDVT